MFAISNGATPSPEDEAWWSDNNCPRGSIDSANHSYFRLSQPLSVVYTGPTADDYRQAAVVQTVAALESCGQANGTYTVTGSGQDGTPAPAGINETTVASARGRNPPEIR